MRKIFILMMVVLCWLTGCQQLMWSVPVRTTWDQPQTVYVCINIPVESLAETIIAIEQWDRALKNWRRFKPIIGFDIVCTYWIGEALSPPSATPDALAWTSTIGGGQIYLVKKRYEHHVLPIVLHELGHALGAQHVTGTLMNKGLLADFTCPDVVTVAQIAAYNKLDLGLLSWCY